MEYNVFEEPVTVIVGLGFPTQVRTVAEAYALLGEWHSSKTDPARTLAINACRAALSGEIEAQTARGLFVAFAHKHDLLAPGTMRVPRKAMQPKELVSASLFSMIGGQHDRSASDRADRLRRGFGDGKPVHFATEGLRPGNAYSCLHNIVCVVAGMGSWTKLSCFFVCPLRYQFSAR